MITLRPMTLIDCWRVIPWRNQARDYLRSPGPDTYWTQLEFWWRVIVNPNSPHYYRSVVCDGRFVGMVGLCHLTAKRGEISLITDPAMRGRGIGGAAVRLMLAEGFGPLGLQTIWGEVYAHNPARSFWARLVAEYGGTSRVVRAHRGRRYLPADRFQWTREQWEARCPSTSLPNWAA